jgi:hypothetical protein
VSSHDADNAVLDHAITNLDDFETAERCAWSCRRLRVVQWGIRE